MKACKFKDLVVGDKFTVNGMAATRINTRATPLTKSGLANAQVRIVGFIFYVEDSYSVFKVSAFPEQFDTRQDAIAKLDEHRAWYHRIGYQILYATLTSPNGTKEELGW